jgi:hypothetical protein
MVSAFDPASCALFVHVAEQAALTCLCPIKRPRMIPRAHRWLRRNSERVFEVVMEDVAESALDMVNSVEPGIALALILLLWLRVMTVAKEPADDSRFV